MKLFLVSFGHDVFELRSKLVAMEYGHDSVKPWNSFSRCIMVTWGPVVTFWLSTNSWQNVNEKPWGKSTKGSAVSPSPEAPF